MAEEFTLDPVSGIPDPPVDDEMILDWARELTKSLRKDHVSSVDRIETMVMSASGLDERPTEAGSRRLFFDEKTGTLYLDSENETGLEEWVKINNKTSWASEGAGVHVIYSSSLPYGASTSGTFSFDEEIYDKDDYWDSGSPTDIDFSTSRKYQILFVATIDNLATDKELLISIDIDGVSSEMLVGEFAKAISSGAGEEYELRISLLKDITDVNTLSFVWVSTATFDLLECYVIITPVVQSEIGSTTPDETGISDHGLLLGLSDDDHSLYLLASDATNRATFASYWTDLTDGGETALHTHAEIDLSPLYLDNGDPIYWRNAADDAWIEAIVVNASDDMHIGDPSTINDMRIECSAAMVVAGGTNCTFSAGDLFTLIGDALKLESLNGDIYLKPDGSLYVDNDVAYCGKGDGGTIRELIKKEATTDITVIGDADVLAHPIRFDSNDIYLGAYTASIRMEWSGGTWAEILAMENTDEFCVGYANSGTLIRGAYASANHSFLKLQGASNGTVTTTTLGQTEWTIENNSGTISLVYNHGGTLKRVALT